jgi:hypothetical protein
VYLPLQTLGSPHPQTNGKKEVMNIVLLTSSFNSFKNPKSISATAPLPASLVEASSVITPVKPICIEGMFKSIPIDCAPFRGMGM